MSNYIKNNKVNEIINNGLKFYSANNSVNNTVEHPFTIVTIRLRGSKKSKQTLKPGLICLWDSGATDIMLKFKHIKPYKSKLRSKTVEYSTDFGPYITTHGVKDPFSISEFSRIKTITY